MAESSVPEPIRKSIESVMTLLKSGDLPVVVSKLAFARAGIPMDAWSMSNRLICAIDYAEKLGKINLTNILIGATEGDYRGFNQWKTVGRNIKKGEKATYILAPNFHKGQRRTYVNDQGKKITLTKNEQSPDGKNVTVEEYQFIQGFFGIPVFSVAQTYGKEIKKTKLELPKLPYKEVADHLGITVVPGISKEYYGAYYPGDKRIVLATPDQGTFFHELAHAVDDHLLKEKTGKGLKTGQDVDQEVVAQMCAATLAFMIGYDVENVAGYTKGYIARYTKSEDPEKGVIKLLSRIESIVDYITNFKTESPTVKAEKAQDVPLSDAEKVAKKDSKKTISFGTRAPVGGWKESDRVPPLNKEDDFDLIPDNLFKVSASEFSEAELLQMRSSVNEKFEEIGENETQSYYRKIISKNAKKLTQQPDNHQYKMLFYKYYLATFSTPSMLKRKYVANSDHLYADFDTDIVKEVTSGTTRKEPGVFMRNGIKMMRTSEGKEMKYDQWMHGYHKFLKSNGGLALPK